MGKDQNETTSTKEELKEEGSNFVKDLVVSGVTAASRLVRGTVNVFRHHAKVEEMEEQVKEHIKELEEDEKEG